MTVPFQIALTGAVAGIISSALNAVGMPRINRGIEKEKLQMAERRKRVDAWRKMLVACSPDNSQASLFDYIKTCQDFPLLFEMVKEQGNISKLRDAQYSQAIEDKLWRYLNQEITRIEKEWKLI